MIMTSHGNQMIRADVFILMTGYFRLSRTVYYYHLCTETHTLPSFDFPFPVTRILNVAHMCKSPYYDKAHGDDRPFMNSLPFPQFL